MVALADSTMHTCCLEQNSNITINSDNEYLPSETGNLTITYDVTQVYEGNYWALVCVPASLFISPVLKSPMNLLLFLYGFLKVLLHQDLLIVEIVSQSVC